MGILLVEDDPVISQGTASALTQTGFEVEIVEDGITANNLLIDSRFDLVILDLTLPRMDGSEVLRRLRERQNFTPVIVISARSTLQDRVIGLNLGADDYLAKPFELAELEARAKALLRRSGSGVVEDQGPLALDNARKIVMVGAKEVSLSAREMAILKLLLKNLNSAVSRDTLYNELNDGQPEIGKNAIEVYIHRLRQKITAEGIELRTIRGIGYMLRQL